MITLITFIPLLAALAALLLPGREGRHARIWVLSGALGSLLLTLILLAHFSAGQGLQFVERHSWIPGLGIDYFVGVDGLNLLLLLLCSLIAPVTVLASWNIPRQQRAYFTLLSLEFTSLFGAFTALNFYHWFLFFELSLVPVFFLIKLYGGELRHRAAIQFILFTVLGSVALLLGFQLLYFKTGTFDFISLASLASSGALPAGVGPLYPWIFLAVLLGLWVKTPLVPLHLWQPETYTQAPAPVSILLSALLSKLGVYGFLRLILPIFPEAFKAHASLLLALSLATILFGAFAAMLQKDLKKLLTYSSLNHVAYCILGISVIAVAGSGLNPGAQSAALQGAILQMFSHGLTVAGLFYIAGRLEERTGTRNLQDWGGLRAVTPRLATVFTILTFSSIGLPFLAGFSSEFPIFYGSFCLSPLITIAAIPALLTTALFLLTALQRIFTGPVSERWHDLPDLSCLEWLTVGPLLLLILWVGINPAFWLGCSEPLVQTLLKNYR